MFTEIYWVTVNFVIIHKVKPYFTQQRGRILILNSLSDFEKILYFKEKTLYGDFVKTALVKIIIISLLSLSPAITLQFV
jgi:hypothetical protein